MKRNISLLVFLFFPLLLQAKVVDRIVAVVNSDVITQYDLDRTMAGKSGDRRQVLEDLINQKLFQQEIARSNVEVTDQDLSLAIENILKTNGINIEILRAELASKGIPFEAYREQVREQVRQMKFIQQNLASHVQVTDQDVERYQSDQTSSQQNMEAHLAWIFLPLDNDASSKDVRHLVRKGRKLTDRARKGEDFTKLEGIDVGKKTLFDLPANVASVVKKMAVGSVSDPIVTPQGVYVVKVIEKTQPTTTPSKKTAPSLNPKEVIYQNRMEQEMSSYVMRLRRKAYIDIRL
ncbi:MAG: hypothetical protein A2W61_00825 [Deltaproteobacteria bacterium RIFCSPLOWO2_01_44_7]|nr:MAG: hypothetical protein A2712_08720 [Deltaproteobacteria bacterium RIFCSPHIGHO2_01_FULL_43_49]OGQ14580.1 MAG: hypothetical protein A3D22_08280 [Deltaproteobacteria bacterium RIFCSPHIGHO2_02_FULL_44_53]OGQ27966.1 MAG: hypothetical protein A3D98_06990 [Deltaproteobacteria bacterium RIFCSPHIGHO2_12_FULL_44_21]OGQ31178.1 MAG: hypothetical protein A2979_07040 [Deltaproteobacteria bacterium RIFCSPLOWO2_01_FULL_45_74]OGQ38781.1 MAG: hypothetical protein A2W61_00825 [Deltaproteobacteria bacterium 